MFLGCILVDDEDEWDWDSGQEDEACSCIQSASWSRTHGFLKPRLLRCLGLRPRSIPGDDSSRFAVVLTRMCAWLGRIFHHSASPHGHTTTPSRTGQSRRPARVCDGVKVRGVLSKLCGVALLAQGPKDPYLRNARDHDDSPRRLNACECESATVRGGRLLRQFCVGSPAGSDYSPSFPLNGF
ncbi:uncharacterized protein K444DRAFT_209010 [Hyaloscypha bicolor E]|uniref:Uncharacterized protein n=1 Tax=Hyaloscypha bicolor E TaxID=1095630 RepID=A0A2J6TPH0_9HELO|nr:uncharacterized protein K444DRAFT_209010 [Hyaloscypha bicolor E]PMD64914.1 hypothetical protein K444DRAFT_209010 [Hyaloscypha bicolor E]